MIKTKVIQILLGLLILASVAASFFIGKWQNEKNRADRLTDNTISLQKDINTVKLTVKELKNGLDAGIDSILKEAKIKPKYVQSVTHYHNTYVDTTKIVTIVEELSNGEYSWRDTVGCIKVEGLVKLTGSKPIVTTTEKKYDNESSFIEYTEKVKKPFPSEKFTLWRWKLPWFRKESQIKETTTCGEVKYHKVEVIKK